MLKKLLTITTIVLAFTQAKAQFSDYGAVDNFFMANPDLVNRAQYAGRSVNPNYLLVNWDQQSDMDQRMISNRFVRLGISSWEDHSQYGAGLPQRDLAVAYARVIGADIVIYASRCGYDNGPEVEHTVSFYAKEGSNEVRRAAPANSYIPSNAVASAAMNRLQDFNRRPRVKGGVWYDPSNDTFNWIGPKFGRRMSEPSAQFLSEIAPFLN
jgi:hypothetical protein